MEDGRAAVAADRRTIDLIRANAGGPYGSAVLKGVQADSQKVSAPRLGCRWRRPRSTCRPRCGFRCCSRSKGCRIAVKCKLISTFLIWPPPRLTSMRIDSPFGSLISLIAGTFFWPPPRLTS